MILMQILCVCSLVEVVIVVELFKIYLIQMMESHFGGPPFVLYVEHL